MDVSEALQVAETEVGNKLRDLYAAHPDKHAQDYQLAHGIWTLELQAARALREALRAARDRL